MSDIEKMRKKAEKLRAPKPRELPSGAWRCEIMVDGRRISVVEDDPEVAHAKALAIKAGIVEQKEKEKKVTLDEAIQNYIQAGTGVLSPTTIRGYEIMRKHRFKSLMGRDVRSITRLDVQRAVSEEAKKKSPKTVKFVTKFYLKPYLERGMIGTEGSQSKVCKKNMTAFYCGWIPDMTLPDGWLMIRRKCVSARVNIWSRGKSRVPMAEASIERPVSVML